MSNTPRSQQIYSVINDIEEKLSRRTHALEDQNLYNTYQQMKTSGNERYEINNLNGINSQTQFLQIPAERIIDATKLSNIKNHNVYLSNIPNYSSYSTSPQIDITSPTNEYYIKKLIKDEFSTLILPYQKEMQNNYSVLDNKINSSQYPNYSNIPLNYLQPQNNNIDTSNFTTKAEYDDKIR